jgi:hypothetical protein
LTSPDIVSVILFTKINNKTIKIRVKKCVIYIYQSLFNGRWYNQNFPIKLLYDIQKNKNWEDFNSKKLSSATNKGIQKCESK